MSLDRNESYWLLDDELVAAVHAPKREALSTYPDYGELKSALAKYAGVAPEQILVTPGSVTAIEYIARAYAGGGGKAILPTPTFYCYESILDGVGAKIVPIAYEEQDGRFVFPLAKTIEALKNGSAKALFLCHPNNPLGCSLTGEEISALVAAARGSETLLVSDEAYFEFSSGTTFLPYLAELPNLIIIRTLSKAFALSGARIGYAIAASEITKKLEKLMLPWPVAYQSATAALALLARADKVKVRREMVIAEREHFIETLRALPGVTAAYPSETNFVLLRVPNAAHVRDGLFAQGIRVALGEPMSHVPEAKVLLKDTLRIAVPAPESEVSFMEALRGILH
ncbi:histidinol-phosphate aminotransferase family protein [Candidatus Kaiserbacteria bacterium]|nr:histidinol-phosphate aminotransferase family protein [Candidatus Kaiserbacteria bacterium]